VVPAVQQDRQLADDRQRRALLVVVPQGRRRRRLVARQHRVEQLLRELRLVAERPGLRRHGLADGLAHDDARLRETGVLARRRPEVEDLPGELGVLRGHRLGVEGRGVERLDPRLGVGRLVVVRCLRVRVVSHGDILP
jgi:hypothetical protein